VSGKYRVLFNVDEEKQTATIISPGKSEATPSSSRGEQFEAHHESDPTECGRLETNPDAMS
jgi:hypothetical protein